MELIQQIRNSHPATTLVILSGYDEFHTFALPQSCLSR